MDRARKRSSTRKRQRVPRRTTPVTAPYPTPAEEQLPGLARAIARLPLAAALEKLAAAWAPGPPLLRDVAQAWILSRRNKTPALELASAGEQLRLSRHEIVEPTANDHR